MGLPQSSDGLARHSRLYCLTFLSTSLQFNEWSVKWVFCREWYSPSHYSVLCFATQEQTAQIFPNRVINIAREHGKPEWQISLRLLKNHSLSSAISLNTFFFFFPHKLSYELSGQEHMSSWQFG